MAITGTPDECVKLAIPVADLAAGMYAYTGILTALYARERGGDGAVIEVSMLEALGEWMGFPLHYYTVYGGSPPPRSGAAPRHDRPVRAVRVRRRGEAVLLGIQNEREWARFLRGGAAPARSWRADSAPSIQQHPASPPIGRALDREIDGVFSALGAEVVNRASRRGGYRQTPG